MIASRVVTERGEGENRPGSGILEPDHSSRERLDDVIQHPCMTH